MPRVVADEEALPFADGSLDLIVSALALQFVNDLPGTLIQVRRALKPDGLLLAALLGGDTLTELREAFAAAESEVEGGLSPRVAPFADVRELGGLLQRAGFALPVVDSDRLTVRYDSVVALMHDLRRMGATNVLSERRRTPLRRATLRRLAEIYAERFADADGRLRATFEIVWLSGWAPHESQQKPLKPGSAAHGWPMRLARRKSRPAKSRAVTRPRSEHAPTQLVVKVRLDLEPSVVTAAAMAMLMPDAMIAYSIAVAPSCARRKRRTRARLMRRRIDMFCSRSIIPSGITSTAPAGAESAERRPAACRSPAACSASPRRAVVLPSR